MRLFLKALPAFLPSALAGHAAAVGRAELHVHLDGAFPADMLFELAQSRGFLSQVGQPNSTTDLVDFLLEIEAWRRFDTVNDIVGGDESAITLAAERFVDFQADSGVAYTEVRYDPVRLARSSFTSFVISEEAAVRAVQKGLIAGMARRGVVVHQLLCAMRGQPAEACVAVAELAAKMRSVDPGGVVGIDLAGDEATYPNAAYVDCFRYAKKDLGLNTTVHSGEFVPTSTFEEVVMAVEDMLADRVGHGYAAGASDSTLKLLRDRGVHVEAAPYSAQKRGVLSAVAAYRDAGVSFGLNTDDPAAPFDAGNISDVEAIVRRDLGFVDEDFVRARVAASGATFAAHAARMARGADSALV